MSKAKRAAVLSLWLAIVGLSTSPAHADTLVGEIKHIDIAAASQLGFRITLVGEPTICAGGSTFAYLEPTDSNYEAYVSAALTAYASGRSVTLQTTKIGSYCHIDLIRIM